MERHVVIGTAGHIDHGKTTLVKALTGVDTDRLAEEKARGITIDLGFAPLELDGIRASIVDVPGHEGFIRNMVAGATGVDLALLVVAADEGVMPQTREHLAILRHLGVWRGVVALSRTDLAADAAWRELVADEVRALVQAELGSVWPVFEVAAVQGTGIEELRSGLAREAAQVAARPTDDRFRLPVDRIFTLAGAGTIVTGTVWSGSVKEGESVTVLPAGIVARVRSIQVHGAAAPEAGSGRRAALALVGLAKEDAARGAVVVTGTGWRASRAIDVAVTLAEGVALKLRSRVRVHHGTAEVMGRVARLGETPEASAVKVRCEHGASRASCASCASLHAIRLSLDTPLVVRAGDRIVLRSYSPLATIGGGVVVDPWAERVPGQRRRPAPALPAASEAQHVATLVQRRGPNGMTADELAVAAGYNVSRLTAAIAAACQLGIVEQDGWFVAAAEVAAAVERLRASLRDYHVAHPLEAGMSAQAWRDTARAPREPLVVLAERHLAAEVDRDGAVVRQRGWSAGGSDAARRARDQVLGILSAADAEPPSVAEVAAALPGIDVAAVLRLLARSGEAVSVADRYYESAALDRERVRLVAAFREAGPCTPAQVRERLGRSRKWLIPLLEWADREGLTVRDGDRRMLRNEMGA